MRKKIFLAPLFAALLSASALAQVSGAANLHCSGESAVISISASSSSADAGRPGAWFVAAHDPYSGQYVAFLTPGGWVAPESAGYLVPYGEYPGGIPQQINVSTCAPLTIYGESGVSGYDFSSCGSNTWPSSGYVVKVGYGVLTPENELLLQTRRARLDAAKPLLQSRGEWRPEYDDDDKMRRALVIKSLRENNRIQDVMTVYPIDCAISYGG